MTISLKENLDKIDALMSYVKSTDAKIKYEEDTYTSMAGAPAFTVKVIVANVNGVKDPFSEVSQVDVAVTGSAAITESNPILLSSGEGIIHISNTIVESVTLSLSDSGSTGLDVSHTASITFS